MDTTKQTGEELDKAVAKSMGWTNGTSEDTTTTNQTKPTTLAELKAGDKVALHERRKGWQIATVYRTTHTLIIVKETGNKFRIRDGYEPGLDIWKSDYIKIITPGVIVEMEEEKREMERIRAVNACRFVFDRPYRIDQLTTDQLTRIAAILAEGKQ